MSITTSSAIGVFKNIFEWVIISFRFVGYVLKVATFGRELIREKSVIDTRATNYGLNVY